MTAAWLARLDAFEQGMAESGEPHHFGLTHGSMRVLLYRPMGVDEQSPHRKDEIYIVRRGHAEFVRDDRRVQLTAGDSVFVPSGMPHRFENFSADFDTWVVFWGPDGGEQDL